MALLAQAETENWLPEERTTQTRTRVSTCLCWVTQQTHTHTHEYFLRDVRESAKITTVARQHRRQTWRVNVCGVLCSGWDEHTGRACTEYRRGIFAAAPGWLLLNVWARLDSLGFTYGWADVCVCLYVRAVGRDDVASLQICASRLTWLGWPVGIVHSARVCACLYLKRSN